MSLEISFTIPSLLANNVLISITHTPKESGFPDRDKYRIGTPNNGVFMAIWVKVSSPPPLEGCPL